jgi:hypothetical protein
MSPFSIRGRNCRFSLLTATLLLALQTTPARAQNSNPGILPPNSNSHGASYGEWSARWYTWAFQQPADTNPLLDTVGTFCAVGQTGNVWFLAGTNGPGTVNRTCRVPTGKALFFPIGNSFCAKSVDPADAGLTFPICQQAAKQSFDSAINLQAEIDGTSVINLHQYRVQSPEWSLMLPLNSIFGPPYNGTELTHGAADGVYLMLPPLSPGTHVIHFHVEFPPYGPSGQIDATYQLTIGDRP